MANESPKTVSKNQPAQLAGGWLRFLLPGIALLGIGVWLASQARQPVYEDRGIAYWLAHTAGGTWACPPSLLADSQAVPYLVRALERPDNPLRSAYSSFFSHLDAPTRNLLPRPVNLTKTRPYVASLLGNMGPVAKPAIHALIRALHAKDADLRRAAATSLGKVGRGEPTVLAALRAALKDRDTASAAAESLWRLGQTDSTVLGPLIASLKDTHAPNRSETAGVLGRLEDPGPEAVAALTAALEDADGDVGVAAALALPSDFRKTNNLPSAVLAKALKDKDPDVRSRVAWVIGETVRMVAPGTAAALRAALDDKDATVRMEAAIALAQLGQEDHSITQTLILGLRHGRPSVRLRAAGAMGRLREPGQEAIQALTDTLSDFYLQQFAAAVSLWRLGETNRAIFQALARSLNKGEPNVRTFKLNALAFVGHDEPTTRAALTDALKDEDPAVRKAAANALRYLDPAIRARAGYALRRIQPQAPSK